MNVGLPAGTDFRTTDEPAIIAAAEVDGVLRSMVDGPLAHGERAAIGSDAFRIASVSKTFTATLALVLVERGPLALDDPLPVEALDGQTLRECLSHRSGLPDYMTASSFEEILRTQPDRSWSGRELLDWALSSGLPRTRRGDFVYSDTGFVAVGLAIEAALGVPLHSAFRSEIFGPLELGGTWLEPYEEPRGPAIHHAMNGMDLTAIDPSFDWGGGGLIATAGDLIAFLDALLEGRIVGQDLLREMLDFRPATGNENVRYNSYGLGIGRRSENGRTLIGHTGAWGSFMWRDEESGTIVAGSVNRPDPAARDALTRRAFDLAKTE